MQLLFPKIKIYVIINIIIWSIRYLSRMVVKEQMISFSDLPLNDELTEKLGNLNIDFAFQPVFRNSTLEKVGHEALMRPFSSSPLQIIKEYSMRGGLHTLELATFFGAAKAYYERGLTGMVSINSFPSECFDRDESAVFFQCFPDIAPKMIVEILEYTELDLAKWQLKKEQIQSNGIRISIDDFGSGNNDIAAVNIFRPDEVKIDRSLITGIHRSKEKQERLIQLTKEFHARNIYVIAEGVETREELEFLRTTDVDYLQGYYLGIPT